MADVFDSLKTFNPIVREGTFVPYDEKYWRKGWKHTEESKALMSKNMKGRIPWNKGKKGLQEQTEEKREKCRIAAKKSSGSKGLIMKEEDKKKRSESLKAYYAARRAAGHKR